MKPTFKRDRSNRPGVLTLAHRRWLYSIAAALVPVAVTFGLLTDAQAAPLLTLAGALLGMTGLALMNPTED